ncbi:MAG: hypothetical protein COB69_04215 [Phycisphaera sp.]|nr:MAG: hypothetical protein COB69_04215 [Phycisphaera sp.]
MRYAVLGGGKRLRPLLVWHACAAACDRPKVCLPAAAAIEYIHAFSLVHDDLPAMDDDDLRRGQPTLHIHTSEAMAILAGDALLNLAFAALTRVNIDPAHCLRLVEELTAGCAGMISGQIFDSLPKADPAIEDRDRLERIHRNKTGALIRAACRIGAICGGASADTLSALTTYANDIGLMFQAVDDLIDVEQLAEHTGKRTGKDADAGKLTYPGLLGVEGTKAEIARLQAEAVAAVEPMGPKADPLVAIANLLATRDR